MIVRTFPAAASASDANALRLYLNAVLDFIALRLQNTRIPGCARPPSTTEPPSHRAACIPNYDCYSDTASLMAAMSAQVAAFIARRRSSCVGRRQLLCRGRACTHTHDYGEGARRRVRSTRRHITERREAGAGTAQMQVSAAHKAKARAHVERKEDFKTKLRMAE